MVLWLLLSANRLFTEVDTSGDQLIDLQEFKQMLKTLDGQLKNLPATAQVASQQGKYLGRAYAIFRHTIMNSQPFFRIQHNIEYWLHYCHITTGITVGKLLSKTNGNILIQDPSQLEEKGYKPFEYKHLGSFAYVGDNRAVLEVPVLGRWNMISHVWKISSPCRNLF